MALLCNAEEASCICEKLCSCRLRPAICLRESTDRYYLQLPLRIRGYTLYTGRWPRRYAHAGRVARPKFSTIALLARRKIRTRRCVARCKIYSLLNNRLCFRFDTVCRHRHRPRPPPKVGVSLMKT